MLGFVFGAFPVHDAQVIGPEVEVVVPTPKKIADVLRVYLGVIGADRAVTLAIADVS